MLAASQHTEPSVTSENLRSLPHMIQARVKDSDVASDENGDDDDEFFHDFHEEGFDDFGGIEQNCLKQYIK